MKGSDEDRMSIDINVLNSHVEFFDRLINAIPAKFYLEDPDDRVDLRSLKRAERAALKAKFKQQHKEKKRTILNPFLSKTTVELLKERVQREELAHADAQPQPQPPLPLSSRPDETEPSESATPMNGRTTTVPTPTPTPTTTNTDRSRGDDTSKESLREKLHAKLQEMRKKRKADQVEKTVKAAKTWRESALSEGRQKAQVKSVEKEKSTHSKSQTAKKHSASSLTFTKVEFDGQGDGKSGYRAKGQRKPSKRRLLAEAEVHAEMKSDEHQDRHSWGAALKRARGEKVYDDPKLLKKSIKKETTIKRKKAAAWVEREAKQREALETRQAERKSNIQNKIRAKKDAKKARREKKLLRAGFEGRKRGFIASPSPTTA